MPTAAQVLDVFRREIGQGEAPRGSNRSKYGAWFGVDPAPWCSMFVCWCFNQAGASGLVAVRWNRRGSAFSGDLYEAAKAQGRLVSAGKVGPGDLVCWDWPLSGTYSDHIGIVESVSGAYWNTIEGNSPGSGFNYDVVGRHQRRASSMVRGVFRPAYSGASTAPALPNSPAPVPFKRRKGKPMFFFVIPGYGPATYVSDGVIKSWVHNEDVLAEHQMIAGMLGYPTTVGKLSASAANGIPLVGLAPPGYAGEYAEQH